jgi:hypothetical protein
MGLRNTVQLAALQAFITLGDLVQTVTYMSLTGAVTRDIEAGTVVPVSVNYTLPRAVFARFKESEIDANVSVLTDSKLLIPALDLPVAPKSADIVLDETGRTWEIVRRLSDPAAAVIVCQVRTSR